MSLSRERLLDVANETGFRPETLEKVIRLAELLSDIGRHPLLSQAIALKGGTALNLFFGPPRRLRAMWQPGDLPRPKACLVGIEELAAGKLCALMDRAMPGSTFRSCTPSS